MKLIIRTKKDRGEATLYTKMKINGKVQWINLLMTVDVSRWKDACKTERKLANYLNVAGVAQKIADIEYAILDLRRHHNI